MITFLFLVNLPHFPPNWFVVWFPINSSPLSEKRESLDMFKYVTFLGNIPPRALYHPVSNGIAPFWASCIAVIQGSPFNTILQQCSPCWGWSFYVVGTSSSPFPFPSYILIFVQQMHIYVVIYFLTKSMRNKLYDSL